MTRARIDMSCRYIYATAFKMQVGIGTDDGVVANLYTFVVGILNCKLLNGGTVVGSISKARFLTVLSQPLNASVTLSEATAPVKLPT